MLSCDIGPVLKHLRAYSDVLDDDGNGDGYGYDSPFRRVIKVSIRF